MRARVCQRCDGLGDGPEGYYWHLTIRVKEEGIRWYMMISDEILIVDFRESSACFACQVIHPWSKHQTCCTFHGINRWKEQTITCFFGKPSVPGSADSGLHQRWVHWRRRWHRRSQQTRCSLGEMSPGTNLARFHWLQGVTSTCWFCCLRQRKEKTFLLLFQGFEITPRMPNEIL